MKPRLIPTEDPQFSRVGKHGAILNTDAGALEQYKRQRAESLAVKHVTEEVASLKRDMASVLEMLRKLVPNG